MGPAKSSLAPSSFSSASPDSFGLFAADLVLTARSPLSFGAHDAANRIRGLWGKSLYGGPLYEKLFAPPHRSSGPSGLKDPPRPFVLRTRHLAHRTFPANEPIPFRVHIFDPHLAPLNARPILLPLTPTRPIHQLTVRFLTPTELKGGTPENFAVLLARLRDRISTLRALYGPGPLNIDFTALAERAAAITTLSSRLTYLDQDRTSRRTGLTHPLGGYLGEVTYSGDLTEFLPYLAIGVYTGVGRQTVWGHGELAVTFPPA